MAEKRFPLRLVDGLALPAKYRLALRPGELMREREGRLRRLPRWFYEVPSWDVALETMLAPHFAVWEFLNVDVRETALLRRSFPRYLPCAVTLLAAALELFRQEAGSFVHLAANGGYRSPSHRLSTHASPHCWGTAANIYRIGDSYLEDQDEIERYSRMARRLLPALATRPFGHSRGHVDDHIHLDIGFTTLVPREAEGDEGREAGEPDDTSEAAAIAAAETEGGEE